MTPQQLRRLLKEFPWLWGITQNWDNDTVDIKAARLKHMPYAFYKLGKDLPHKDQINWLVIETNGSHQELLKVPISDHPDTNFIEYIHRLDLEQRNAKICFLALTFENDLLMPPVTLKISIFRPPNGRYFTLEDLPI